MMAAEGGALQQAKLVLLGDMGAGKSSVVLRFVKGQFFDYQVSREETLLCTYVKCCLSVRAEELEFLLLAML